jgi:hypothetical protein
MQSTGQTPVPPNEGCREERGTATGRLLAVGSLESSCSVRRRVGAEGDRLRTFALADLLN